MTWRLGRLLAPFALAAAISTAALADEPFRPHSFNLANGMQVVVIPDHRAPVVTHQVWFRTGSADDPRGASGIAHFFEHLMFRGTSTHPDGEFDAILSRNGADNNATTYFDRTVYYERLARDRLALAMELNADRMVNLVINDETVATERNVILEERAQRIDNEPSSLFWEQMNAALYLAHPYGIPVIGWRAEIADLSTDEARDFYAAHYGPNNAVLVVAGDVTVDEVKALAEKYYGPLKPRDLDARVRPQEPPPLAARRLAMTDPRVGNPMFARLYLAPSYKSATDGEAYALQVMAYVLGGAGDNSRLGLALVKRDAVATAVSAWYDGEGLDDRNIGLYGLPAEGKSLAEVEKAIDAEIAKFVAEGPTPEEVARAKANLAARSIYAKDSSEGLADYYGEGLMNGQTLEDLEAWPQRIEAVTADQVKAVAAKYFKLERSVTGTLEPSAGAKAEAAPAGSVAPPTGESP